MSMMTFFRRAFGFSPETEEEDDDYNPAVPQYAASAVEPAKTQAVGHRSDSASAAEVSADDETKSESDTALPADLFDAVIELFNNAQPDFVKKCLNVESQRQYILNSLSESLKGRLNSVIESSAHKWDKEKSELEKKIADLEGDDNEMAKLRQENRRLKLSVDRQKRALLDRINDLETQVARQSEEKERFFSKKHTPATEELAKANSRIKELEEEKSALETEKTALEGGRSAYEDERAAFDEQRSAFEASRTELTAECDRLRDEVERQTTLKEQLEVKTSMSDAMINDLRNQAATARQELEKMQRETEDVMEQIKIQLDGFEDLKARKDAKIAELQEANASLRRTIETNLYNQANSEMKLRSEIKSLRAQLEKASAVSMEAPAPPSDEALNEPPREYEKAPRKRGRPKKVRIDSELDNTEWFSSAKDDSDFGYHEPPRRPVYDSEAQLSLF